nr:retrotransposon Orf1 [Tanacetum cinerariifolium]
MDLSSSIGKTCLGKNIIEIFSDKAEGHGDWSSLEFQDTTNSGAKKETKAMVFHKMDIEEISDRFVAPCFVNGLKAYDGEINLGSCTVTIYPELDLFLVSSKEEEKNGDDRDLLLDDLDFGDISDIEGVNVSQFSDKYKKILDGICLDKMKLDGINKEEEEAMIKIKGEALIEKDDPGPFFISTRLEGKINLNALADTGLDINTMPYRIYKELGRENVQNVGVTIIIGKFLILDIPIDRDTSILLGRGFLHTCGGILNTIERIASTFDEICHQTFRAAQTSLDTAERDSYDEKEYVIQRNKFGALIYKPKPARDAKSRYNTKLAHLLPRHVYPPRVVNWEILNRMGCSEEINGMLRIKLCEAGTNEEIFTFVTWIRAFNINEPIYLELCHEFYLTYESDEVCADDELQTNKIIKFRLRGCAHSLTLFEFAQRLGLYHAEELDEEGFDVYFQGGLHSDEHFNAQEYWLSISREENLSLLRSHVSTIQNPVLGVVHKIITYGLCQRTTGYDKIQKNDLWLLSMFDARHQNGYANVAWLTARKAMVLSDEVIRSLSAPIYCRDLDTTTLKELIDSEGRLIPEALQPDLPRVAIPRPPGASMQDLYERMLAWRYDKERLKGWIIDNRIIGTSMLEYLSTWLGFIVYHCREPITHLVMLSHNMISIISSTHRSISSNNSRMMMSSVKMTQVKYYYEIIEELMDFRTIRAKLHEGLYTFFEQFKLQSCIQYDVYLISGNAVHLNSSGTILAQRSKPRPSKVKSQSPGTKTTYLRNEITIFLQKSNETFNEAWERFKELLHQCPHHGFSKLHQLDTFYNALNPNDQDALDSAAGGNFLDKIPRECLSIIESKSKVKYSRSKVTDVRANANATISSSSHSNSFDLQQIAAALE